MSRSQTPENAEPAGRFSLRDVPGTTVAVVSLAVLGAAAIVSAPLAVWYWRKRKRADALASHPPDPEPATAADSVSNETGQAQSSGSDD